MSLKIDKVEFDLTPLLNGDDDSRCEFFRQETEKANRHFIDKWKGREDFLTDANILGEALDEYESIQRNFGAEGPEAYYFWLRAAQDSNNPVIKARYTKISDFSKRLQNEISFFQLKISRISKENQELFLKEARLEKYQAFLERLFKQAPYQLSEAEEKILNLKSNTAYENWVDMVESLLAKEEKEILNESGHKEIASFSTIIHLIDSQDKNVRDEAAKALNSILEKHSDVAEHEINSILQDKKVNDDLRGFKRADESRQIADNIEPEVIDVLLASVASRNDSARRFYKLKAQLLGLNKLAYHERNIQYGQIDKEIPYEEGLNLVYKTFTKIDQKFADILEGFNRNGQIDVYPRKYKHDGAFCVYFLMTEPTYILLNYTNKLKDVLTLAHEAGHGINNELGKEKLNALDFGTSTATAEVASIFMEDFVLAEITKESDDELKLAILMMKLNDLVSKIFRQVALYRFEQELHDSFRRQGYLAKEEIGRIFIKYMSEYMGDYVEQSAGAGNWWIYWSHIRSYFYTYSYASATIISMALQKKFREDHKFIEPIKEFLASGVSKSPKNIFLKLGIDISRSEFWEQGLDEFDALLTEAEDLAKKLKRI